jgi:hypothetical protein
LRALRNWPWGFRPSETVGDLRHFDGDGGFGGGRIGGAVEHFGFKGRDAVDAPGGVDQFLDELPFGGGLGLVFAEEILGVALVGGGVFGGQEDGAAGESVGGGIEGGAEFAGAGAGSGGELGVRGWWRRGRSRWGQLNRAFYPSVYRDSMGFAGRALSDQELVEGKGKKAATK